MNVSLQGLRQRNEAQGIETGKEFFDAGPEEGRKGMDLKPS